ncbi:MAG: hypothetical protein PVF05_02050 [Gemmatimonadales bacterium]|jgi:hypothetical protein
MPPVPTSRFALRRVWPVFALLAAAGCGDDLSGPRSEMCDDQLAITTTEPGVIRYLVAVTGEAVVNRVTYTTPAGDTTLVNPEDESADELLLRRDIQFSEAVEATIRVQGEVASTGEIGFTYAIVPDDAAKDVILGPTVVCNTATQ